MGGYFRAGAHVLVNLKTGYCTGNDTKTQTDTHTTCHLGPAEAEALLPFCTYDPAVLLIPNRAALRNLET